MEALNLNNLTVDSSGKTSFSGLTSGIDFAGVVDSLIEAKRIPAVTLETRITDNDAKISALADFRTVLDDLKTKVDTLRGKVSVGGSGNVFLNKQVFTSTTRTDGIAPSAAGNLVGVTADNAAAAGNHDLEIRRTAAAHKISSASFADTTIALGLSGNVTISNGATDATIAVASGDTLIAIRDKINNANTGTTPTGVTASVISVTSSQNFLILTKDTPGASMVVTDSGTVLSGLGFSTTNGVGGYRNGLGAPSKIETGDGFKHILFDGGQQNTPYLVSYDSATRVLTLTDGAGATDTATLASGAIASGDIETATFANFGVTIDLDSSFDKATDITVAADTVSVTGGTGAIDAATVQISASTGNISGITATGLTFGNLATPTGITVTAAGGFSGSFDGSTTGLKTVTLSDGSGNSLQVKFNVTAQFNGSETAGSITLNELQNLTASAGGPFSNELQKAQTARFTLDGLKDTTHFESLAFTSATAVLPNLATTATYPGSFTINGTASAVINYTSSDTLTTLKDKINLALGTTGVTAKVVADGTGFRLDLDSSSTFTLTDTNGLVAGLGINDDLVIERATNTVSDVVPGLTMSLFQAEPGTKIKIEVDRDLNAVKTALQDFVTAYNAARVFINTQNQVDPATGLKGDASGVLFGNRVMNGIRGTLSSIIGVGTAGVSGQFSVLAQVGIDFVDNNTLADPLQADTLVVDDTKLDATLLNNIDDVRRLFAFDFSASDPNVSLISFGGNTTFNAAGYTLDVGTVGNFNQDSASIVDKTVTLDQSTSAGATVTGSQSFQVNGQAITYDIQLDTLQTLAQTINTANINGVTATVVDDTTGAHLSLASTTNPLTVGGDTGDLIAKMPFTADNNILDSANFDSVSSSATVSGRVITATNATGAEGLKLFYAGPASVSGITLNFTQGLASDIFFALDDALDLVDGSVQGEVASLQGQNLIAQDRIDSIDARLAIQRQSLTARFVSAELAISQMQTLQDSIKQTFDAFTKNGN